MKNKSKHERNMKEKRSSKVLMLACAVVLLAGLFAADHWQRAVKSNGLAADPYRIMVVADPHYLAPALTDDGEYYARLIGNSDGKTVMFGEELLDAVMQTAREEKPDLLLFPGDLTFNGERESLQRLVDKLGTLPGEGIGVLVIPGNHDIDSPMAVQFQGDSYAETDAISTRDFDRICRGFSTGAAVARDEGSLSYVYESARGLRLLMLDVNGYGAMGTVSEETVSWAERQLRDAQKAGLPVLAVSHQNLLAHNDLFQEGFQMGNAAPLQALYEKYGVVCNLSGHMHLQHIEGGTDTKQEAAASTAGATAKKAAVRSAGDTATDSEAEPAVPEIVTGSIAVYPHYYGMLTFDGRTASYQAKPLQVNTVSAQRLVQWQEKLGMQEANQRSEVGKTDAAENVGKAENTGAEENAGTANRTSPAAETETAQAAEHVTPQTFAAWSKAFFDAGSRRQLLESLQVGGAANGASGTGDAAVSDDEQVKNEAADTGSAVAGAGSKGNGDKQAGSGDGQSGSAVALSSGQAQNLADTFARLNRYYFAGRADKFNQIEGLDALQEALDPDSMFGYYVHSILQDDPRDSRSIVIRRDDIER